MSFCNCSAFPRTFKGIVFIPAFILEIIFASLVIVWFFLGLKLIKLIEIFVVLAPIIAFTGILALDEINKKRIHEEASKAKTD